MASRNKLIYNNLLLIYNSAIYHFEKYIEELYKNTNEMKCGYLINLKDYDDLKKKIYYSKDNAKKSLLEEKKLNVSEKIYTIKEIEKRTPEYLIDMITKGNKYIMVDQKFWKIFCEKGKENNEPIFYDISQNILNFTLINKTLKFNSTKSNIIDKSSYINDNKEHNNIKERAIMFSGNNYTTNKINNANNKISNKNNNNCNDNNKSIQNNKKDSLFQFLEKIIAIHNSQLDIQNIKRQFKMFGKTEIKEYILINRNYMDKFESHMNFKEINEIIINKKMNINSSNLNQKINELKDLLKNKPFIKNLENIIIQNKLDCNYDLSKKEKRKENSISLYYIDNAQIINKDLLNNIKSIDKNFVDKYISICYFTDNKIIIKLNQNILNIGHIDEKNIFVPEFLIFSKNEWNIMKILEKIKQVGYNSFIKLKNNDLISFATISDSKLKVEAKIIEIDSISDKLKCIILLFINNKKLLSIGKSVKYEKVFLINKKWLEQYNNQYKEIASLIEKDEKVNKLIEEIIKNNSFKNGLNNIISKLDKLSLKNIDEKIVNNEELIKFNLNFDIAKLFDKQIYIMKDFIIVNEFIFDFMKSIVDSSISKQNYYFFSNKEAAIIGSEMNSQYFILIGNLDAKDNLYEIKYILDFNSKTTFENEKNIISASNLETYINTRIIYNDKRDNDYVSPIFNGKNISGNCYKYKENMDYTSCQNYSNILLDNKSNTMIMNSINIYFNTQRIIKQMKTKIAKIQKYYLINKNLINQIKIDNDYKIIKYLIEEKNLKEGEENNKKNILSLIKSLPEDDLYRYTKEITSKIKYEQQMEPDIIQACYCDETNKSIFIYDFDLFEEKVIKLFIDDLSKLKDYYLDCTLIEDKIIINYPDNLNGKKYISIIGTINSEYDFETEYLLIFNDKNSQNNHMRTIKSGLSKYLNGLSLVNNSQPILKDKINCEIVGIIAKYDPTFQPEINTTIIDNNSSKKDSKTTPIANNTTKNVSETSSEANNTKDKSNLNLKADASSIRINFKDNPPLIGLQNIGATCYMNSTLQCLCHIEKFVDYFKYNQQAANIAKEKLSYSFKLLMDNLWPNNYKKGVSEKFYVPQEFKEKISKMNPLFEGIAANDAKDLVNFIIMTLHLELNKANENNNSNNNNYFNINLNNLSDPLFKEFIENFQKGNNSIIKDLFYAFNCNSTQCTECTKSLTNYQAYFFLNFPLEEVRKFKESNFNNNYNNNNINNNFNSNYNNNFNNLTNSYNPNYNNLSSSNNINNNFNNLTNSYNQNYNNLTNSYNPNYNNLSSSYNPNYNNLTNSYNPNYNNLANNFNASNNFNNLTSSYNPNYNNLSQSYSNFSNNNNNVNNNFNNLNSNCSNLSNSVNLNYNFNNNNNFNNATISNINNNNMSNNNISKTNEVTIYDCFDFDKKVNLMSGENQMFCNNCRKSANCNICTQLVTSPEILIIILNRGKGIEFDVKINFSEELNLSNYIQFNDKSNYQLIGVITHIGESSMSGHFIAYCKDPITNKWYKYNDAMVNEVENFQKEVIDFAMPYLLFYQRK